MQNLEINGLREKENTLNAKVAHTLLSSPLKLEKVNLNPVVSAAPQNSTAASAAVNMATAVKDAEKPIPTRAAFHLSSAEHAMKTLQTVTHATMLISAQVVAMAII